MPFVEPIRTKVLLWSDRHCCLCKKACGPHIEVHHIVPKAEGGTDEIDNAIPLCFDCHGVVGHYNASHPKGTKFKPDELRSRRDQVYEEFTRHLVPPVDAQITQRMFGEDALRKLPDVGFDLRHLGTSLPVKVRVRVESLVDETSPVIAESELYNGTRSWNLNPSFGYFGHFTLTPSMIPKGRALELRVTLTVIDVYDREHRLLPVSFVYEEKGNFWWANP